ncbi:hypothetical protein SAMN05216469_10732 [Ruminococcus albus]|uniref:Uncharacterized protein n=1 Tax=Ruminococcus albus TaxID=1264 RepID=A0A1H7KN10_RUMAL|nr:hypothetical protein SAMN05216469_10732 [Ruminococcus albus]
MEQAVGLFKLSLICFPSKPKKVLCLFFRKRTFYIWEKFCFGKLLFKEINRIGFQFTVSIFLVQRIIAQFFICQ